MSVLTPRETYRRRRVFVSKRTDSADREGGVVVTLLSLSNFSTTPLGIVWEARVEFPIQFVGLVQLPHQLLVSPINLSPVLTSFVTFQLSLTSSLQYPMLCIRVYHLARCGVFLWFYRALYLWKQIGMLHFSKTFIPTLLLATKVLKSQWGSKIKFFNPFHFGV